MWFRYWLTGHPFHIPGFTLDYCYFCFGWGCNPDDTHDCWACYGRGWARR